MHHATHWVDLAFGAHDVSLPLVGFTGERGAQCDARLWLLVAAAIRQRQVEIRELIVGQRQPDLGHIDRVDRRDRVTDAHKLSDVDVLLANPASVWRNNRCAFEVPLGSDYVGLGSCNGGARVVKLGYA